MKKERSEEYLDKFRDIINNAHNSGKLVVFTDGSGDNSKQGEPIKFGFLIYENGKLLAYGSQVCNDKQNTSVKSEIMGINAALSYLLLDNITDEVILFSDNKWVVDWAVNKLSWYSKSVDKVYYEAFVELRNLIEHFKSVQAIWIPRELNENADQLTRYNKY